ncbi:MAG TPA: S8 family peptidase [Mobilitalea sp.]|nr:S8 family peptidase [Mobilitalea sp.]
MTSEDINKIYSNDYADFFINYSGDLSVLEQYRNDTVNIINFFFAIVHLPVSQMSEDVISKRGYAAIPSLFGLDSETSLEASGILRIRRIPNFDLKGEGVLIGIADTGIDYTNPIFQFADKTTKISSIWDQTIISDKTPKNISYGTEYTREQINEALKSDNPFDIVPSKDEIGHGTMVAGIAAGNEVPESGFYGVAPDSEFIIVKLKPAKPYLKQFFRLPENAIAYQENDLIFGLQYLLSYAAKVNKPIVLCIAIDTSQYAHDGRGTTSSWLSLEASMPGIAALIAVGNEGNARRHYSGLIKEDLKYDTVELNIGSNESGFSMELWGTSPNIYSIDITSPSGEYISRIDIRLDETREISFVFEPTIIYVDYQMIESQSSDQLILLRFSQPTQGVWKFKVYGKGIYPMNFNIWLPMNYFIGPDTFFIRSDPYTTLLSLSCADIPITVTAYNTADDSLFIDSGKGYTRTNIIKPDIAAPGVNILSPSLNHGFIQVTGTSTAVAHAAGVAAMLFEWGIVKGNYPKMSTQDIKIFMIRGARRNVGVTYPNRDWGYGILDVFNVFDRIRSGK